MSIADVKVTERDQKWNIVRERRQAGRGGHLGVGGGRMINILVDTALRAEPTRAEGWPPLSISF